MKNILLVDDERSVHYSFEKYWESSEFSLYSAFSAEEALSLLHEKDIHLVLLDIKLPGISGLEFLQNIKKEFPKILVIIITGYGSTESAIEAIKWGAFDYITKPFDLEQLQSVITRALETQKLMHNVVHLSDDVSQKDIPHSELKIIGHSLPMQSIYKIIGQISSSTIPVIISGESGTGKELIARAIYHYSDRNTKPFMVINCAAIPENLLESELFGYEKGAFTGADEQRIGKFEQCDGGTIFLDEIGDMSMRLQAKLLRILQQQEFQRVGSTETIKVNVRIISATNKDLLRETKRNNFREDLYYRLNVVNISIPPLRERKEDIVDLVHYFINRFNVEFGTDIQSISEPTYQELLNYSWPGNIRELENIIKRGVVLSKGSSLEIHDSLFTEQQPEKESVSTIDTSHLSTAAATIVADSFHRSEQSFSYNVEKLFDYVTQLPEHSEFKKNVLGNLEEQLIPLALDYFKGNQVKTARFLGITRNTLRTRMEKMRIGASERVSG
ncbi:sigma-54-dependent transcriptional regulator [Candidatus Margulisiibacteriota bacterium]